MKNNTEILIEEISEHLQEVNDDEPERLRRINEILDFLNYNKRITELTKEEKAAFYFAMEGGFSESERTVYEGKKGKDAEVYLNAIARANYFRKCAWMSYLSGETKDKPIV